jgi:Domain of unknown function (DUF4160)
MLFVNDHPPAHVHAIKAGAEARIAIGGEDRKPFLMSNDGLSRRELALALEAVDKNRALLLRRWREIHVDV